MPTFTPDDREVNGKDITVTVGPPENVPMDPDVFRQFEQPSIWNQDISEVISGVARRLRRFLNAIF